MRENIVLPLLVIQQYALHMLESGAVPKEVLEKIVTRSFYGNINASRNSAYFFCDAVMKFPTL